MSFNQYYQSELSALRELGRRFADRNPALAPFLGQAGRDPDVERLFEGFAFLTGRLRQKLDDEIPELSHSLMNLLWPNYMRPLPAFSMLQFDPLAAAGAGVTVERHTVVDSGKIDGVSCRFQTCYATQVDALKLCDLSYAANGEGASLRLHLSMTCEGHLGQLELSRLRLHLAGERYISQALYLGLLRHLRCISLTPLDADGVPVEWPDSSPGRVTLPADNVLPVGFAEDEALIPYPLNTFRGYRLLQEYFAFQDKFLFVDVQGLEVLSSLPANVVERVRSFRLDFDLNKNILRRVQPTLENIKVYCTPIVNLFKHDAAPIRLDGKREEYLLLAAGDDPKHCGIYSVDDVTGLLNETHRYQTYVPFESFEHDASFDVESVKPYYSVRQRSSLLHDGVDTYLSVGAREHDQQETLSVTLTCTNQNLPLKIRVGDICEAATSTPSMVSFRNILPATASYAPPLDHNFLWKLVSNMSLNYLSLENVDALRVILETYDFPGYYDRKAKNISKTLLNGLKSIRHEHTDRMFKGLPLRGLRTELTIDPEGYLGEGDLFVFTSVLNEFFALYASLNSYHELNVKSAQGEVYQWTPRMGLQPLL